ncbi:MAG: ADP-glyceromanno-heptose 6-epimerase [Magnetococcales bacterium]|nr:ADP-glyceromanno-heptose 6-epimerase [Magnetococcales bacterium]
MYIVTGGAGFIGANIVAGLNQQGETDILIVDNMTKGEKFLNLRDLEYADFMDKTEFRHALQAGRFSGKKIQAIFHEGACSDTMEYNGQYMMDNNFTYSKELFHFAVAAKAPFVYASSAATYGDRTLFVEHPDNENPLNVYGYSKLFFDRYVARFLPEIKTTVAGLRYFNVYGPREEHKGRMASMVYQLHDKIRKTGQAQLFCGSGGYEDGGQRRDFIHVSDVVDVNLFLARSATPIQGAFNVGTGKSRSFNAIVKVLFSILGPGELTYRPMPEILKDKYQNFTEANIEKLRQTGYDKPFKSLEEGIATFVKDQERRGMV